MTTSTDNTIIRLKVTTLTRGTTGRDNVLQQKGFCTDQSNLPGIH